MPSIPKHTYGKNRVRLVMVRRDPPPTELIEWKVDILFEGDYEDAYRLGDNSSVLPTDTMKNTVYSLARSSPAASPEEFAIKLTTHFLEGNPEASRVTVDVVEKPWEPIVSDGKVHLDAFRLAGDEVRTASAIGTRDTMQVRSGLSGLTIMKTAGSGFAGFKKDKLTTLPETADRLLGTNASAEWGYSAPEGSFRNLRQGVRNTLLREFAEHQSRSVQHTLYAMGEAVLAAVPEVTDIRLTMPNLHCLLVDLSRFGQDNPNEIFVPIDEPHGFIEAHIVRS
jgi:urate oxidase